MTQATGLTVGWCPGALRPMQAADGLILRVKPRNATLDLATAERLGELATHHGNGWIDLTQRANLQIRGVTEPTLRPLTVALAGLGLLDQDAETEAVRNIVVSPMAGLDPARSDVRPIAFAIEREALASPFLRRLAAKWSIVVDDGGPFSLANVPADIRVEAHADGFLLGLAADPLRAFCLAAEVPAVVLRLASQALEPAPCRMADLVQHRGAAAVLLRAGLTPLSGRPPRRTEANPRTLLGHHSHAALSSFGVGIAFGALPARSLVALTRIARDAGVQELRLTPWRMILLAGAAPFEAATTRDLADQGFIVDAADPRVAVAACTGKPGCRRATTAVREEAGALAASLAGARSAATLVHVSGCPKGCAHPGPAPWTLVARDGRYDVIRHGTAADTPVALGLTFQKAASWVTREVHETA